MSVRVYPIRFTRKSWHIRLYSIHDCINSCNYKLVRQRGNSKYKLIYDSNFSDNCDRNNKVEHTIIPVKYFDINSPKGLFGNLYDANKIVIPEQHFYMVLSFPLSRKIKIHVNEPLGDGFMLKEILYAIKIAYEDIYNIEENTASQNNYIIMTNCDDCFEIDLSKCIKTGIIHNLSNNICAICQDQLTEPDTIELKNCIHQYHQKCIEDWINNNGKTCPICREQLYKCSTCNGNGNMIIYHEGAAPPFQYRGMLPRIQTNGIYGIYDFYLEELFINDLKYNRQKNELFVSIQT